MQFLKSQKAVAFLETIISLPLLLIIGSSTIEASRFIRAHVAGAQLAYEGARMAASWAGLVENNEIVHAHGQTIRSKMILLARMDGMPVIPPENITIQPPAAPQNTVEVSVVIPYSPFINLWGKDHIVSKATVPYFYRDDIEES